MPKVEANVDTLLEIANHIYSGEVRNLAIRRYKTGKNAGKLFAEYSLNDNVTFTHVNIEKRQMVAGLLRRAAKALTEGKQIELNVTKMYPDAEVYAHRLEIRGGTR